MKWMKQFGIVLAISFVGELLERWIPLPIPASIYGIVLLFLALQFHVIPLTAVQETGDFLMEIMPMLFIPAAVGLLDVWSGIGTAWISYLAVVVITTVLVMAVAGRVTQTVIRHSRKGDEKHA